MQKESVCPHYPECSSCSLARLAYRDQLKLKADDATSVLNSVGLGAPKEVIASTKPFRYRARAEIHCRISKDKRVETGYLERGSKKVVALSECKTLVEPCERALIALPEILERHLPEKILLHEDFYFKTALFWEYPKNSAIVWIRLRQKHRGNMPNAFRVSEDAITPLNELEPLFKFPSKDLELTAHPNSFTQVNWYDNARLVREVIEITSAVKPKSVLELHSGVGNFSVHLARLAEQAIAVEAGKREANLLKRNLEMLDINNVIAKRSTDIRALEKLSRARSNFDLLLCDPPRGGLGADVVSLNLSLAPTNIIYVSCNPTTLARDLKILLKKYQPVYYKLLDLFAQTAHIEAIVWLTIAQ